MAEFDYHSYKSFIHNEIIVKEFFETVLVPLEKDEVYYILCQARKKYSDVVIRDPVIKRKILESNDFDRFMKIIYECSILVPLRKDVNVTLDRDMSVIYIDINPKSMFKAYKDFRTKMDSQLESYYLYNDENIEHYFKKIRSHVLSAIARSIGTRKIYSLFDLDTQDSEKFNLLVNYIKEKKLNHTVKWISKTKNGYHFIIQVTKEEKSKLLGPLLGPKKELFIPELEIKDKENTRTPGCGSFQEGVPVEKIPLDVFK